jgi:hypothetical protein
VPNASVSWKINLKPSKSMNEHDHLSPQEKNIKLLVQVNAYLETLGRDPIPMGNQTIANSVLARQLQQLQQEYQATKP